MDAQLKRNAALDAALADQAKARKSSYHPEIDVKAEIAGILRDVDQNAADAEDELGSSVLDDEPAVSQAPRSSPAKPVKRPTSARRLSASGSTKKAAPRAASGRAQASSAASTVLDVEGNSEATIRLHKAKIAALEADVDELQGRVSAQSTQIKAQDEELRALRATSTESSKKGQGLQHQKTVLEKTVSELKKRLGDAEATIKDLTRTEAQADKDKRAAEAASQKRNLHLNRALEDLDKYKRLLEEVRGQQREGKDRSRGTESQLLADNKRLEREKKELLLGFQKQSKLIDVLRRQKVHLEAARQLDFTEKEFRKLLAVSEDV